jgi:anti-anti-sigma factor
MTMPSNRRFSSPDLERRTCPDQSATAKAAISPHARQPVVVTLPSEIDLTNASEVHDALTRALESGTAVVVVDATKTTFCDCAGVRALIRAHRQATAAGADLRVASTTSRTVRRILELTGADQVLDTYPTLTAARDGPAQAPASPALREHATTTADFDGEWLDGRGPELRAVRG